MYPANPVNLSSTQFPVKPGDKISAEVQYTGSAFVLSMYNVTESVSYSITISQSASSYLRSSAEWVVEAPTSGATGQVLPLANFGIVNFSGCSATLNGHTGSISDASWQNDPITMETNTGAFEAVPSALSPDGKSFSVADAMISYTVSAAANPTAGGTVAVSPSQATYYYGSVLSISETTNPGYAFAGWKVTGGTVSNSAAATTSLTISGNCTLTASYTPLHYPLSAAASPTTGGTVAVSPSQANYTYGSVVTISETTNPGYSFTGWAAAGGTVSNSTAVTASLTITSSCTLTANYTQNSYGGTETDVGGSIVLSSSGLYTYGQVITATETASNGYVFAGWSVTGSSALSSSRSAATTTSLTVYGNFTLTASFTQLHYTLTASASPTAGGTVSVSPSQSTYTYGNVVAISETANPGYTFTNWTVAGGTLSSSAAITASLTVQGNVTLTANYTQNSYSGTETDVGGSIALSSSGPYYYGTQITASAAANPGYMFTGWTATGVSLSSSTALSTTLTVLGNFTLTANFIAATLTASATLDNTWVYQNTPVTTLNRQCRTMTITIPQDTWPDQSYTVLVSASGSGVVIPSLTFVDSSGSGSVTPTSSFVFTGSSATLYLVGGLRQADGLTGTGSCTVTIQVTGDVSGAANATTVQAVLTVRSLGDITGDGTVTAADRVQLMQWFNGVPTPDQAAANFDLDGDGTVTTNDLAILNTLLNNLPVP